LILSGGIFHDFAGTSAALARLLQGVGVVSRIEDDLEAGLRAVDVDLPDLVTINALRWEMQGEKYDAYRDSEALSLSETAREAVFRHLARGGAILGMHTASICFSDWPEWRQILGGVWVWGQSWHPAPGPLTVTPTSHAAVRGRNAFTLVDELYSDLDLQPDIEVLLTGTDAGGMTPQPVLWRHEFGGGRIVYDALGHDPTAFEAAEHREILCDGVAWALGKKERDRALA
jgi:type 1 glutamine amidotransferase